MEIDFQKELDEATKVFEKHQKLYELFEELYPQPNYLGIEDAMLIFDNGRLSAQVRMLNLKILNEENPPSSKG